MMRWGSGLHSGEQRLTCAAVPCVCHSCQDEATWGQPLYKHEATQDGQTYAVYKRKAESPYQNKKGTVL